MPAFKGTLTAKQIADVSAYVVQGDRRQPERLTLSLPDDFPRDVRVVATDFDRTLVWDGQSAARGRSTRFARADAAGLARDRRHRAHGPVGAAVPRAGWTRRTGHLLPGCGRRGRRRKVAATRADPARAGARDDRRSSRTGLRPNVYVDDELYVADATPGVACVREASSTWRSTWSATCSTGSTSRRRSSSASASRRDLDEVEARMKAHFGDRALHLEVAAALPRVRRGRRDEGRGPRLPGCAHGFHARADDRLRRRRERRRARRMGRVRHRRRERARPREGGRDWICPSAEDEGVAQVLEALLDSKR